MSSQDNFELEEVQVEVGHSAFLSNAEEGGRAEIITLGHAWTLKSIGVRSVGQAKTQS